MGISKLDIENMKKKYPTLICSECDGECVFSGEVFLNHVYDSIRMTGKFIIEITVPRDFPLALPIVRELSERIDKSYPHQYIGGYLCLASNLELKIYFNRNNDFSAFVDEYIIPYFYTYRFFEEYGVYPYGERSHGSMGDLEYLKDLLGVNNWNQVYDIMVFVVKGKYRGHIMCPCGSSKRIRDCHGHVLKQMIDSGLGNECSGIITEIYNDYKRRINGTCN